MFLTKLALRNLTRHKKRTVITSLVISLGIFIFLVSDSLMVGLSDMSLDNNVDLQTAHLQIMEEKYWEKKDEMPLDNLLKEDNKIIKEISNNPQVKAYTPRLYFTATINNGREDYPIKAIGINTEKDVEVIKLDEYILEGEMLQEGKFAIIGKGLAELMDFRVNDYITLLFKTKEGTYNTIDAKLIGLLDTPHPNINKQNVYIPLSLAQNSLNTGDKVSRFLFNLETREQSIPIAEQFNRRFSQNELSLKAYNWEKLSYEMLAMLKQGNIENLVMLFIIIILATAGVINTVILSALERLEEIGMMKALGLRAREIVYIFVIEAAGIGIIGSTIGVILGGVGVYLLKEVGISLSMMTGGETTFGIPIAERIYGGWNPETFFFIFIFGILVSVLASILPARWGAKKDPVKALYHK